MLRMRRRVAPVFFRSHLHLLFNPLASLLQIPQARRLLSLPTRPRSRGDRDNSPLVPDRSGDKTANLLEWHTRHAIALGITKGLRFLHEECRAGPIIHRGLSQSNVLLTHDFVPMLGDFGLAKWKASNGSIKTRILGQSGYLAPEYAEYGIVSVRTDVYAFGIVS